MCQVSTCGLVWAPGPTPSAPKQWKSYVHGNSWNSVSATFCARLPPIKFEKGEKYREHSNMPNSLLLALTTKPWDCIDLAKKLCMTCYISQTWTDFLHTGLSFADCSSWISRPDKIYKNYWQRTLGHRLGFLFTQFSLNAHWAAHWPQKRENWELEN